MPPDDDTKPSGAGSGLFPTSPSASAARLAPGIPTHQNCAITPRITGPVYFAALKKAIDALGTGTTAGQFIYIAGWHFGAKFAPDGSTKLADLLIAKAQAGVDVRVLGWVMAPEILQNTLVTSTALLSDLLRYNADTMNFINALRAEPKLAAKACLNILAHPVGSVHMKMVVLGSDRDATAFTGGLDLQEFRQNPIWHDVEAEVAGPVVQGAFNTFREMWNEIRSRKPVPLTVQSVKADSHSTKMPDLPARTLAIASTGPAIAQSVRTVPQMRFKPGVTGNQAISYAPQGVFELRDAWQHGIAAAESYIYIEDQSFISGEVFDWCNTALKSRSNLRVVVLRGQDDPSDNLSTALETYFHIAVNNHLLAGLNAQQTARVGVFRHQTKVIHTKSTIVDDAWAIIGSANCMRRGLYTDFEHAVVYVDEYDQGVPLYRMELWGVHLHESVPDPDAGLQRWFGLPLEGATPPDPRKLGIVRLALPLPRTALMNAAGQLDPDRQVMYDEIRDADSRQEWPQNLLKLVPKLLTGQPL